MDAQQKAELSVTLAQALLTDNEVRRQAEEKIKVAAKNPAIVPALLEFLHSSPEPPVRHLAALILRKRITQHWMKLGREIQDQAKAVLLENIVKENTGTVRRAVSDVVGVIAKHAVPAGEWPGLLEFLHQCTQSSQEEHREVALVLFCSLAENIPDVLSGHFTTLQGIFLRGLGDSAPSVRRAALNSVMALLELTGQSEEEFKLVRDLVHPIIQVTRACLETGEEDTVIKAFEMLNEIVEGPSKIINPVLPDLVQFCLEVAGNTTLDLNTRQMPVELLGQLAVSKPKQMVRLKLIGPVLTAMCMLSAEPRPEDFGDDDFQLPACKFAPPIMDIIAQHVAAKHVTGTVLHFYQNAIGSSNFNERRAALSSVAVIAEGCAEMMRKVLKELLPGVMSGLTSDASEEVRAMSAYTLSQFAMFLQPDILSMHANVLPGLFNSLRDPASDVQEKALEAVEIFCDHLEGDAVVPYMAPLMELLMHVVKVGAKKEIQLMALAATCSVAKSGGSSFVPYLPGLISVLQMCMSITQPEMLTIRAQAIDCFGLLLTVESGAAALQGSLPALLQVAVEGFSLGHAGLREFTHSFFGHAVEAMKDEFAPYLPHVMQLALQTLQTDDGNIFEDADQRNPDIVAAVRNAVGDSDDEDDEEAGNRNSVSIRTGIMDEKAAATHLVGKCAEACPTLFGPYVETMFPILKKMGGYFHEDVRQAAMPALQSVVLSACACSGAAQNGAALPPAVQSMVVETLRIFIRAVHEDEDADAVSAAMIGAAEVCKTMGGAVVHGLQIPTTDNKDGAHGPSLPLSQMLSEIILQVLREDSICQGFEDSEDEDEEPEEDAADDLAAEKARVGEVLMEGLAQLLPAMCELSAEGFIATFTEGFPLLMRQGERRHSDHQRSLVTAILVDCMKALGNLSTPCIPVVMPYLLKEMQATDPVNRRNAAFCAGNCFVAAGAYATAAQFIPQLQPALNHLMANPEEDPAVVDNAAGALARVVTAMLAASPTPQLPLADCLNALLIALPIKEDDDETEPIYLAVCQLLSTKDSSVVPLVPRALQAFGGATQDPNMKPVILQHIADLLRMLAQGHEAELQALMASLPAEQQAALSALMNSH